MLAELLSGLPAREKRLLVGPGIGEDAAVLSFGSTSLVAKSDPVTFATALIGWYAVHVNANDIAATGGTPKWFLPTVLIPEDEPESTARQIFEQLRAAADSIGVRLIGGHTEITVGLPRTIICGTMLGEVPPSGIISTSGARSGDSIILTGGIAIEGLSLLAREFREKLMAAGVSAELLDAAAGYLHDPGISVLKAARAAVSTGAVTSMHDPTEGGLATALAEVAEASGTGLEVTSDAVPMMPGCAEICGTLGLDPWGLIASGALLITCNPDNASAITGAIEAQGIRASVIGKITSRENGLKLRRGSAALESLPVFERDEIARMFE